MPSTSPLLKSRQQQLWSGVLCVLLSACGGGGSGEATPPPPGLGAPAPAPAPDTAAPTVSASVNVGSDTVTFTATAADNVGVTEVVFLMDGDALEGTLSTKPNKGTFSLPISINFIADGTHSVVARARDAAGNSKDSSAVSFVVQRSSTPPEPPTVTASVDGNFGLVRFSAVKNIVNVHRVDFLVDGQSVGLSRGADGDAQFLAFDVRGLADGRHSVVARVRTRDANGFDVNVDSAPVAFDVDSGAGISEVESNDEPGLATAVADNVRQIVGQTEVSESASGTFPLPHSDYYRLNLPAQASLRIDMRTNGYQFIGLSLTDAAGNGLASSTPAAVKSVTYTSGDSPQEIYIRVTPAPARLDDADSKYLLLLSRP
jgi:hypothetical protein